MSPVESADINSAQDESFIFMRVNGSLIYESQRLCYLELKSKDEAGGEHELGGTGFVLGI